MNYMSSDTEIAKTLVEEKGPYYPVRPGLEESLGLSDNYYSINLILGQTFC